jgi:uncharacterized alkaline shock family protein YloU
MTKDIPSKDRSTDLGVVHINNEAITTIASIAAMEVRGVARMGSSIGRTILEILFARTSQRGVKISTSDGEVKLTVSIIVEYGTAVPRVADEVQENVKRAVEKMTGLVLSEVDVVVEGVHLDRDKRTL